MVSDAHQLMRRAPYRGEALSSRGRFWVMLAFWSCAGDMIGEDSIADSELFVR